MYNTYTHTHIYIYIHTFLYVVCDITVQQENNLNLIERHSLCLCCTSAFVSVCVSVCRKLSEYLSATNNNNHSCNLLSRIPQVPAEGGAGGGVGEERALFCISLGNRSNLPHNNIPATLTLAKFTTHAQQNKLNNNVFVFVN